MSNVLKNKKNYYVSAISSYNNYSPCLLYLLIQKLRIKVPKEQLDFIFDVLYLGKTYFFSNSAEKIYCDFDTSRLKVVYIPKKITIICSEAFIRSVSLTTIVFPEKLRRINNRAFKDCVALEEIDLPDTLKIIGDLAFYNCINLKNIKMSSGITKIGKYAFKQCPLIKHVYIKTKHYHIGIGKEAFNKNVKLHFLDNVNTDIEFYRRYWK